MNKEEFEVKEQALREKCEAGIDAAFDEYAEASILELAPKEVEAFRLEWEKTVKESVSRYREGLLALCDEYNG